MTMTIEEGTAATATGSASTPHRVVRVAVVGSGPHALCMVTKLLEERIDPQEEAPWNTRLFSTREVPPGDGASGAPPKPHPPRQCVVRAKHAADPGLAAATLDKDLRRFAAADSKPSVRAARAEVLRDCEVIDPSGRWMAQWDRQFEALGIPFLRSPLSAHPDPIDAQMLRLFAEDGKRRDRDFVQLELPRDRTYHGPYAVPSTEIFREFCQTVVKRYRLEDSVRAAKVLRIVPFTPPHSPPNLPQTGGGAGAGATAGAGTGAAVRFLLHLDDGATVEAEHVVLAIGTLNLPVLPSWATEALRWADASSSVTGDTSTSSDDGSSSCGCCALDGRCDPGDGNNVAPSTDAGAWWRRRRLLHSNDVFGDKDAAGRLGDRLLVVGGGLTAGHLVLRALRTNPDVRVTLVTRRALSVRQFDLDLEWMGFRRTSALAKYWSMTWNDYQVKADVLRESKNGGSMTPEVLNALRRFASRSSAEGGRLEILEEVEAVEASWTADDRGRAESGGSRGGDEGALPASWHVRFDDGRALRFSDIWCSTGTCTDIEREPLFQDLLSFCGDAIQVVAGRPVVSDDLRVCDDINVHVMGNYAALCLGPGALNLMGGRAAASRIARALKGHGIGLRSETLDPQSASAPAHRRGGRGRRGRRERKDQD